MKTLREIFILTGMFAGICAAPARADVAADTKAYAVAADAGDWTAASAASIRLLDEAAKALQPGADERIQLLTLVAEATERAGRADAAIQYFHRLVAEIEARDGAKSWSLVEPLRKLAGLLAASGRLDDAAALHDRVIALSEAELGVDDPWLSPLHAARREVDRKRLAALAGRPEMAAAVQARVDDSELAIETLDAVAKARAAAGTTDTDRSRGPGDAPFQLVTVHYGTNREPTGSAEPARFYGDKRGPLALGVGVVSVPKARAIGEIPLPTKWRGDFRPDAAKHFILTRLEPVASADAFAASARARIEASRLREALVFIHGYNSDFEKSMFRAAQLAVDLGVDGAAFMYSWPSKGSLPGYVADGAQVIRPVTRGLQDFLTLVARRTGAERVHVVAHSMGNRYLLEALDLIARDIPPGERKPMFEQMVFAAPDVDAEDFTDRVGQLGWMARRMTLYASSKDRALYISSIVNGGYRRAGDAGALVTAPGLDTVDTTEVSGEGLGHGDFADRALDDFRAVVWLSLQPKSRCVLVDRKQPSGGDYWALTADQSRTCAPEAFRTAISLLRGLGPVDALAHVREKISAARAARDVAAEARYGAMLPIFDAVR